MSKIRITSATIKIHLEFDSVVARADFDRERKKLIKELIKEYGIATEPQNHHKQPSVDFTFTEIGDI